ncbi:MAG: TadE family protein [Acetobacteraceae bacterium]
MRRRGRSLPAWPDTDCGGQALAEFVLIAGVLSLLLLGMVDVGGAAYQSIALHQALSAGGEFAINHAAAHNRIVDVVRQALPSAWTDVTVPAPRFFCQDSAWSCVHPPPEGATQPLSAATCGAVGQAVYLVAERPHRSVLAGIFSGRLGACYVGRFQ